MIPDKAKLLFSFKKILSRKETSVIKAWYEENPGKSILIHAHHVWIDEIPNEPAGNTDICEYCDKITLTEDITVADHKAWFCEQGGDFIGPVYGQSYLVRVFDGKDNEIPSSDVTGWLFDYENGVLSFKANPVDCGWSLPIKITGYRYTGRTLADVINGSTGSGTGNSANLVSQDKSDNYPSYFLCPKYYDSTFNKVIFDRQYFRSENGCIWYLYIDNYGNVRTQYVWCPSCKHEKQYYYYYYNQGMHNTDVRNVSDYLPNWELNPEYNYWYYFCTYCRNYYNEYHTYPDPECSLC